MSKRGELKNLSKIIEDVFSQKHFRIGIDNIKVQEAWVKTMGNNIQKYTYKVYYKKGILYVKLKSSVLKEELTFEKVKIIKIINKELGKEYIKDMELS
ncbi:DciA family protein [Flavobacteriaceae bacterium]|nr:DciA family protein [Flavobacteriaceae bacterium]